VPGDPAGVADGEGGTPLRVLVVDDEFLIADYIAMLLEEAGHIVVGPAGSASEALAMLQRDGAADAAVLDIRLPGGMDGIELAAEIHRRHGPMPIVFASGSGDPTTRQRAEAVTLVAFLQKPIEPVMLLRALTAVRRTPCRTIGKADH
jgi:CheY-like chemotaxis protein